MKLQIALSTSLGGEEGVGNQVAVKVAHNRIRLLNLLFLLFVLQRVAKIQHSYIPKYYMASNTDQVKARSPRRGTDWSILRRAESRFLLCSALQITNIAPLTVGQAWLPK